MKGGITSGIVYPGVVLRLAAKYRFSSIGGSSAGAIAAALSAAAEYGRQRDESGGIERLEAAVKDLLEPGRLVGLFQPTRASRRLFTVLSTTFAAAKMSLPRRILRAAVGATLRGTIVTVLGAALLACLVALTVAAADCVPVAVAVALAAPVALVLVVATMLSAMGLLVTRTARALRGSNFGMCPGTRQDGQAGPALIDWLHERIQACAGLPLDQPLTFRRLEEQGIRLTMMTTDLSLARPVRVPDGLAGYCVRPADFAQFPPSVVEALERGGASAHEDYRLIPVADLPVLVGVRLSLSFPILMSAMPLYKVADDGVSRHLLSDGGIASNFPIHFFDAWFPSRPTFGIDLAKHPVGGEEEEDVFMLSDPLAPVPPRWGAVDSLPAFVAQIKDTMQNWRDTLQSELPGYRDRVCQIRFDKGQGGLHLSMDPDTIKELISRGDKAGAKILETFDERQWLQHRWVRYLTLVAQLQDNLHGVAKPLGQFGPELDTGLPEVRFYREGRGLDWCVQANEATAALLALAGDWGPPPLHVDLDGLDGPAPRPEMRIVPRA
jgi:predicted acylesterase/phospholipase RssA